MALPPWLVADVWRGMRESGVEDEAARRRIMLLEVLGLMLEPAAEGDPLASLAKAAGVDEAFCARRATGTSVDGVRMLAIEELSVRLRAR